MDLPFDLLGDPTTFGPAPRGIALQASRASLYRVAGLAADRVEALWGFRPGMMELSYGRTGTPDIAETIASLSVRETAARGVLLHGRVERLSLGLPQEPVELGCASCMVLLS